MYKCLHSFTIKEGFLVVSMLAILGAHHLSLKFCTGSDRFWFKWSRPSNNRSLPVMNFLHSEHLNPWSYLKRNEGWTTSTELYQSCMPGIHNKVGMHIHMMQKWSAESDPPNISFGFGISSSHIFSWKYTNPEETGSRSGVVSILEEFDHACTCADSI